MYPQVVQFETLELERARALQLNEEIRMAALAAAAKRLEEAPHARTAGPRHRLGRLRWRNA
jgi:hypothetical protein